MTTDPAPGPRLLDSLDLAIEQPEPEVWALLDLAATKHKPPRFYPKNSASNVHYVLSQDTRWLGRIRANDFDGTIYVDAAPMRDRHLTDVVLWLERVYSLKTTEERVAKTLVVVADEHAYHPVRDYLDGLTWDGEKRVGDLVGFYFGALPYGDAIGAYGEDAPDVRLLAAVGRCFLVSCVARIYAPGCKVDTTPILVGAQGALKSSALRALADPWFNDTLIDLHTKDLYESLQGVWIYELAELDAFRRSEWSKVKAVLSSPVDRWRSPYARTVAARPRQVVFAGTTNQDHFLGDGTGSRRFLPVRVGTVRLDRIRGDRDQLWAEAVHLYRQGAAWWLDNDRARDLAEASREFAEHHPWTDRVASYLVGKGPPTTADLLEFAVKKLPGQWTRADENEVGNVMRQLGYRVRRQRDGSGRIRRVWQRDGDG